MKTPESKLRKKILLKNTLKLSQESEDSSVEKSPVCSLFNVPTDRAEMDLFGGKMERTLLTIPDSCEDDKDINRNDAIERMRSPGEDDLVEMSMKSAILSSDEYSSSYSESEEEEGNGCGSKEKGIEESIKSRQDPVKHKPPKPKSSEKLGGAVERVSKRNLGDTDAVVVCSLVLSSDEYSQDSGEENIFTTEITDPELTKPVACLPKGIVLKKRVSFGSIKDEYWEEHWNTFWKPQSGDEAKTTDDVDDSESNKVNSWEFMRSLVSTGTNESGTIRDVTCKITTSTPSHLLGTRKFSDIMGSSSSDDFSPMDTGNSSGDSAQEAILRAVAVLECSEGSRSSNIEMQSVTPETQSSCPESASSHTSEWESDVVTSESSITNSSSKEYLTDISRAGSIDEIANFISKTCIHHALQTAHAFSTQAPFQRGHQFQSPSETFVPSSLVSTRNLYSSSSPIINLSTQLHKYAISEDSEQSLEDIDAYMTVKSEQDQIVPSKFEKYKHSRINQKDVKKVAAAQARNENAHFGNQKLWEWNKNFLSESSEIVKWESVQELIVVDQVAESIVKPNTHADEFLISDRPMVRDDATLIANRNVQVDNGWCQTRFFPCLKSNTPTPVKRRRSYFPDLTGDLVEPEELLPATPKIRYFKSPGSPEQSVDEDHVPDSCDRVSFTEKLPMIHNIGSSPQVIGKICEDPDKPQLEDLLSPVIPYMRGKLSTTIDVLQESPESGRCSKELDVSDPKSVESTPIGDSYSSPDEECSLEDSTVNSPDSHIASFNDKAYNERIPNNYGNSLSKLSEDTNVKNDAHNLGDVCDTTAELNEWSYEFDTANKCTEPDQRPAKEMNSPVRPQENAGETTADGNFQIGEAHAKHPGSAVENDVVLNKVDDLDNQVSELTNEQGLIDNTHHEKEATDTSDNTNEEELNDDTSAEVKSDNPNEEMINDNTSKEKMNDSTSEEEINDSTSEEVVNDSTSEEVVNDSTSEEVINDGTSEEVIIDSTSEEVINDSTSEVVNDSTREEVINASASEEVINASTNEEVINDSTSDVVNDSTSEEVINDSTSEEVIIDSTSEEVVNDSTSEEVINDSTNGEVINDSTSEEVRNDSTSEEVINDSINGEVTINSKNEKETVDTISDRAGDVTLSEDGDSNNRNLDDISDENDDKFTTGIQDDVVYYGNVNEPPEEAIQSEDDISCTETLNSDIVQDDVTNETESSQYESGANDQDDDDDDEYTKGSWENKICDVDKSFDKVVDKNEDADVSWETISSDLALDRSETFDENKRVREW